MGKQQRVALRRSPAQGYGRLVRSRRAVRALDRTPQEPLEGLPRRRRGFCFLDNLSEVRMLTTFYFAKNDRRWVTFICLKTISEWGPARQRADSVGSETVN